MLRHGGGCVGGLCGGLCGSFWEVLLVVISLWYTQSKYIVRHYILIFLLYILILFLYYHRHQYRRAITSVEWCPHDSSTLATTAADNQLAVWDLALERDPEEEMAMALDTNAAVPEDIPPQLMFVHAGQVDMKVWGHGDGGMGWGGRM